MLERRFVRGPQVKIRSGCKPGIDDYAAVFNEKYDSGWFIVWRGKAKGTNDAGMMPAVGRTT
jgi:hypothetical protein